MGTKLAELFWAVCFAEGKRASGLPKGKPSGYGETTIVPEAALIPNWKRGVSEQRRSKEHVTEAPAPSHVDRC